MPIVGWPGGDLTRYHDRGLEPVFFGKAARWRFDAPDGRFGVMYAGDAIGAFAESWLRQPRGSLLPADRLRQRSRSVLVPERPLRLVDLAGAGLARLGLTAAVFADPDYADTQTLAAALHDHADAPDGLLYRSRHDPEGFCVALFDRSPAFGPGEPWHDPPRGSRESLASRDWFLELMDRYEVGLSPGTVP